MAKTLSRTVSIYIDGKQVDSTLASLRSKMVELQNQQKRMTLGSEEYIKTSEKIREINGVLREHRKALESVESTWDSTLEKLSNISDILMGLQSVMQMGDAAIGSLKDLVADAAQLDDAYADVMKTTGLTHDQVKALNEEFKKMDTRTSREQLNQLAYEAGKLGLNTQEAVAQFVSASDKINIALGDVLGEGAMVTIGKLADIYSKSTEQMASKDLEQRMLSIGSAINSLGQASTANEGYMVDFLQRLGGIATQAHLSADQILGFASALDQNGQQVEMSATAFQKLIQQMIKKPEEFVASAKMSLGEFRTLMETDMNSAIQRVLSGMNEMGSLNTLIPMFADMGLDGARAATVVASLAGSLDKVAEAQAIANEELTTGNSVMNEFNTKNNSMQAQAEKAKKSFEDMRIELGEQLYPVIIHLTRASTAALNGLSGYLTLWKENKAAAIALTGGLATLVGWYTRSYAIKLKDKALDLIRQAQHRIELSHTRQQAAAEAKLTAQRAAARVATIQQQISLNQKILSDEAEYVAMGQTNLVIIAQNNLRRLQTEYTAASTVATEANVAAQQAQKAVFASTPWGLVITALTSIAFLTAKWVASSRQSKKEINELNAQIGSETSHINYLFDKLQDAERGTQQYKDAVNDLKEAYPDLIQNYIDEAGYINNISLARTTLISKIREQIAEQKKLEKVQQIGGNFESGTKGAAERIRNWMIKKFGDTEGQDKYEQLMTSMAKDYDFQVDSRKGVTQAEKITGMSMQGGRYNFRYGGLIGAIEDYNQAVNDAYSETKKLDEVYKAFGVTAGNTAAQVENLNDQVPGSGDGGGNSFFTPDPKETKDTFDKVQQSVEQTLTEWQNKQKTGIDKIYADIDAKAEALRQKVNGSSGSATQKNGLLADIDSAVTALKQNQVDEYLTKLASDAESLQKTTSDNPFMQKIIDAAKQLNTQLTALDAKAAQVSSDLNQAGLSEADRSRLSALLEQYDKVRSQLTDTAYSAISFSVDASTFKPSDDVRETAKAYAEMSAKIQNAKEAAQTLLDTTTDPQQRDELKAQIDDLDEQKKLLEQILEAWRKIQEETGKIDMKKVLDAVEKYSKKVFEIWGSINDIYDNANQKELKDYEDTKDAEEDKLEEQYENGIISQEEYTKKKEALQDEYDAKQEELGNKQFHREQALSMAEAAMDAALSIIRVFSGKENGGTASRIAQAAIVGAATLAQITAIATEPEPYAKGGYTSEPTILVGERGQEWVASNSLLNNPRTAPVISALEQYQRGNTSLLDAIAMQGVDSSSISSTAAYRQQQAAADAAMLSELRLLRTYLSDPRNRQAVISRTVQESFDANENFLRNARKL